MNPLRCSVCGRLLAEDFLGGLITCGRCGARHLRVAVNIDPDGLDTVDEVDTSTVKPGWRPR